MGRIIITRYKTLQESIRKIWIRQNRILSLRTVDEPISRRRHIRSFLQIPDHQYRSFPRSFTKSSYLFIDTSQIERSPGWHARKRFLTVVVRLDRVRKIGLAVTIDRRSIVDRTARCVHARSSLRNVFSRNTDRAIPARALSMSSAL